MRHSRLAQSYQYTPPSLEVTNSEILNRVQPTGWRCHTLEQMSIPELKSAPVKQPCRERSERVVKVRRSYQVRSSKAIVRTAAPNLHDIHQANICRSLERRIQAARERGDDSLLHTLMAEMQEIVCSVAI